MYSNRWSKEEKEIEKATPKQSVETSRSVSCKISQCVFCYSYVMFSKVVLGEIRLRKFYSSMRCVQMTINKAFNVDFVHMMHVET